MRENTGIGAQNMSTKLALSMLHSEEGAIEVAACEW